jgi:hypothetical protein
MSLMRGSLFGGSLFAGLLFSHQHANIWVIGPPESDAKCIVYVSRNVAEIWTGDYRALSVSSDLSKIDVAQISVAQWQIAEREIVVVSRRSPVIVGASVRVVIVAAEDHAAIAGLDYPVDAHANDVLYIQSMFRLATVGGYSREIMVGESARVVNVTYEEEVTT